MTIPTECILGGDNIQCSDEPGVYCIIQHLSHHHPDIITIPVKVILRRRESEFNWVEIRRIWWQKFTADSSV